MDSTICLFDVDGTLTLPRKIIDDDMFHILEKLQTKVKFGVVGGSDYNKIKEQLGGFDNIKKIEYVFSENGLICHKYGELFSKTSMSEVFGEDILQNVINYVLRYLSSIVLPFKRGTFIEFRTGMINISPVGRNCTAEERNEFEKYDKVHKIRETMMEDLRQQFGHLGIHFAIGGQISFDVFPTGWDKRYCLRFVKDEFRTIHFYGDKTFEGGNDFEIFNDNLVTGHTVRCPDDTKKMLIEQFGI